MAVAAIATLCIVATFALSLGAVQPAEAATGADAVTGAIAATGDSTPIAAPIAVAVAAVILAFIACRKRNK